LIVNGGHYMTRGHVNLCLLYIRMRRNVKNYFGAGKGPVSVVGRNPRKVFGLFSDRNAETIRMTAL
jgi:hypothetical protein